MSNKVTVSTTTNTVTITPQENTGVSIETTNTPITVNQGSTSVVQVASQGPQGITGPQGPTGSQGPAQDTGSLLVTASYSNPNLTLTKGDGSTFNVGISTITPTLAQVTAQGSSTTTAITASIISASGDITSNIVNVKTRVKASGSSLEFSGNQLDFVDGGSISYLFRGTAAGAFEAYYAGNKKLETTAEGVNITGNITASGNISSSGDISAGQLLVNQFITHNGDDNTRINFTDDRIQLEAGGIALIGAHQKASAPHQVTINNGGNNVNFVVKDNDNGFLLKTFADTGERNIKLYQNGNEKLSTQASGINIIGSLILSESGHITASGNISASSDLIINNITASGEVIIGSNEKLYLNKGEDTYIQSMAGDIARVVAGGNQMLILDYDTGNRAVFGNGTKVYIGSNNNALPTNELEVEGNVSITGSTAISGTLSLDGPLGHMTASGNISSSRTGSFGYITTQEYIAHKGDENTAIRFTDNKISLDAGGMTFFAVHDDDSAPFTATVNGGSNRINFKAMDKNNELLLKTDSDEGKVNLYYSGSEKLSTSAGGIDVTGNVTASSNISASGNLLGGGLNINGPSNSHVEVGTYDVGFDQFNLPGVVATQITGSGLIVSGNMADQNHHNMIKIGDIELVDVNTVSTQNQFLIHNAKSFKISSGSDGGDITQQNRLMEHDGTNFKIYSGNVEKISVTSTDLTLNASNGPSFRAPNGTSATHFNSFFSDPDTVPAAVRSIAKGDMFRVIGGGHVTASAVSSSGTSSFAQISLPDLPTSDPGIAGRLFTTQSAGTGGNLDGQKILLVSQG